MANSKISYSKASSKKNQPKPESPPKITVVGVGNLLLKDEGIGVHIIRALLETKMTHSTNLEIIDGGTSPDLPHYLKDVDKLIIIDAVKGGSQPGTIYRFSPHDVNIESKRVASVHEMGLEQSLKMMKLMGNEPKETVIIGIEPKEIDWGTEPSIELQQRIPEIIKVVLQEISQTTEKR